MKLDASQGHGSTVFLFFFFVTCTTIPRLEEIELVTDFVSPAARGGFGGVVVRFRARGGGVAGFQHLPLDHASGARGVRRARGKNLRGGTVGARLEVVRQGRSVHTRHATHVFPLSLSLST